MLHVGCARAGDAGCKFESIGMYRFWHANIGHFRGHTTSVSEFTKIILSFVLQQPSDTSCGHDCHNTLRAYFDTGLLVEWSSTARLCQVYACIPVVCMTSPVQFPGSQIRSLLSGVLVIRMIRCWDLSWGSLFLETSFEVWRFLLPPPSANRNGRAPQRKTSSTCPRAMLIWEFLKMRGPRDPKPDVRTMRG